MGVQRLGEGVGRAGAWYGISPPMVHNSGNRVRMTARDTSGAYLGIPLLFGHRPRKGAIGTRHGIG